MARSQAASSPGTFPHGLGHPRRSSASGDSVAEIVATHTVPRLLPDAWALAIYGAKPGSRFTAPLD